MTSHPDLFDTFLFLLQLPKDGTTVYFRKHMSESAPPFQCDLSEGCFKGQRSPDGKALEGYQYATHECFWLGKPCEKPKIQNQNMCSDPEVKICGKARKPVNYTGPRNIITYGEDCVDYLKFQNCDEISDDGWTDWFQWVEHEVSKFEKLYFKRKFKRRRFCTSKYFNCIFEETQTLYHYDIKTCPKAKFA